MIRLATAIALLLAGTTIAWAQTIDDQVQAFIDAPGFDAVDTVPLEIDLSEQWLDTDKVSPGGTVGPIEKALLIATRAIPSTRTRTQLSYGELIAEDGTPVSLIEVIHYNLGPTIHDLTVDEFGADDTADAADFGLGDHMAWRFAFQPLMNNSAVLLNASVRTVSDKEASKADCMGRTCLDLDMTFNDVVQWTEMDGNLPEWPEVYAAQSDDIATPAFAVSQLAVLGYWANAEAGHYQWTGGEHPESVRDAAFYRFIAIDRNLGQDSSIDVVWRESALNDDELSAIAFRRAEVIGDVYFLRASRKH